MIEKKLFFIDPWKSNKCIPVDKIDLIIQENFISFFEHCETHDPKLRELLETLNKQIAEPSNFEKLQTECTKYLSNLNLYNSYNQRWISDTIKTICHIFSKKNNNQESDEYHKFLLKLLETSYRNYINNISVNYNSKSEWKCLYEFLYIIIRGHYESGCFNRLKAIEKDSYQYTSFRPFLLNIIRIPVDESIKILDEIQLMQTEERKFKIDAIQNDCIVYLQEIIDWYKPLFEAQEISDTTYNINKINEKIKILQSEVNAENLILKSVALTSTQQSL